MTNVTKKISLSAVAIAVSLSAMAAPEYAADVPESLLTPDSYQSKYAGELTFVDGFPQKILLKRPMIF